MVTTPSTGATWREKLMCCYISLVVHKPIHMKNETWTTINIRSTCWVATFKKKKWSQLQVISKLLFTSHNTIAFMHFCSDFLINGSRTGSLCPVFESSFTIPIPYKVWFWDVSGILLSTIQVVTVSLLWHFRLAIHPMMRKWCPTFPKWAMNSQADTETTME